MSTKETKEKGVYTSFSYPDDLKRSLELLAKKEHRSLTSYVGQIINEHCNELERRS